MNRKNTWLFTVLGLMLLGSCDKEPRVESNTGYKIIENGKANIQLAEMPKVIELDEFSAAKNALKGITDVHDYYFYNSFNQSIYIYDLENEPQTAKKIIKVPLDESIHFYSVSDLFYHNADSIFIWDEYNAFTDKPELFLINADGAVINTFKVYDLDRGYPSKAQAMTTANGLSMLYHKGKMVFLSQLTRYTKDENWKPIFLYDLDTEEVSLHGSYPSSFYAEEFGQVRYWSNVCLVPELSKVVVSFPFEANLFTLDLDNFAWTEFSFQSDAVAKPPAFDQSAQSQLEYIISNSWYLGLSYDPSSGLIWRTAQVGSVSNTLGEQKFDYVNFLIDLENQSTGWVAISTGRIFSFFTQRRVHI